jgi:hypothetical protein
MSFSVPLTSFFNGVKICVTSYFINGVSHEGKYCTFNKILVRKAQISVYGMSSMKINRFLGKTGWSSTSDRNYMSSQVLCSETSEKKQKFLSQVEDHPGFPNNACKYLFLPYTNNFHYRHWSVTNLHKLSDQYHRALWNTHHIKLTFVTPIDKLSSFLPFHLR